MPCRLTLVGPQSVDGFILIPGLSEARRDRVAARLSWLAILGREVGQRREFPRLVPHHRRVKVRFADVLYAEGEIEDLSKSGARIRFPSALEVHRLGAPGTQITVGKRYAIVVRSECRTIAVHFRLPFTDDTFNPSVVL